MKPSPIVSVIMNCYNSDTYLREAIDSVYAQSFDNWEIVFFDNNSSDDSAQIANSYDNRLCYYKNDVTVPLGEARNLAIMKAKGVYIAFLDCDDVWLEDKLALQVEAFKKPSGRHIGFCYTDAMRIDEQGHDLLPYSYEKKLYAGNAYKELIYTSFIACSACMVLRSIFDEIGYFDPELQYVEEWDLWIRIARQYDLAFVNQCMTQIRIHGSNISRDLKGQYLEKVQLAKITMDRDPEMKRDCKRSINISTLQYQISRLFFIKGKLKLFSHIIRVAYLAMTMPVAAVIVVKRYFNLNLYNAFKKKYFTSDIKALKD